jgi:hypothetical protein
VHLRTTWSSRQTCVPDFVQLPLTTTVRGRNRDPDVFGHRVVQSVIQDEQEQAKRNDRN